MYVQIEVAKAVISSFLVELGYIKGKDYNYLSDNQKLEQIGEAIAKGIVDQVHKK